MNDKVGFITPNNQKIWLDYRETRNFCIDLCFLEENYQAWLEFQKDYTYFESYFDFVILHLNYIFINPLSKENTYLKGIKDKMYLIETTSDKANYSDITELVIRKRNGGNYADLVSCSDKSLNMMKIDINVKKLDNWLIDPNGYALIDKSNEQLGNHEITATTILNQLFLLDSTFYYLWKKDYYAVSFLIEHFGFLRTTAYQDYGIIIGNEAILSEELEKIKNYLINHFNSSFYDLASEKINLPLVSQKYYNKLDLEERKR